MKFLCVSQKTLTENRNTNIYSKIMCPEGNLDLVKDKKNAALKSAEYLFATKGFDKTTVADIAKECGINEASIYSYFNNKRNILFAIYGTYLQQAVKTLQEHFLGMKEPGPKLRKTIWHYLSDMKNNHYYARINMMAQRANPDFFTSEYFKFLKDYSKLILNVIITGQDENFFRPELDPRLIRNMAMGTGVFVTFDSLINNRPYDPHEDSDQARAEPERVANMRRSLDQWWPAKRGRRKAESGDL